MSDDTEKATCPDCDEQYSHLGIHWARSKECDYPILTLSEEAVLDGLMFAGGSLNGRSQDSNCYVSIAHPDKEVLDWIGEQLGVLLNSITEFDPNNSIEYYGGEKTGTLWELRTRSLPALDKYYGWYDGNDDRTVPEDVTVKPLLLKTACLLAARPMDDRPGLYLSLGRTTPLPTVVHRVFGGYGPRVIQAQDGYVVRIGNSTDLCNDLRPWPYFARDRFDPEKFREGAVVCPRCGGRFRRRTHLCERVEDGDVVRVEDASPGGSREIVEVEGMRARVRTTDEEPPRLVSWTREDCIRALLDEYESAGRFPTNPEYDDVQKGREDLPSLATLYARFGDRKGWIGAMRSEAPPAPILELGERLPETLLDKDRRLLTYYEDVLPDKERIDVRAVLVDGVPIPGQGDKRGISRKVVHKNVRRARRRLRDLASKDGIPWAPGVDEEYPLPESAAQTETGVTWTWAGDEGV